jgi:iron complex outermembrane receptor protein
MKRRARFIRGVSAVTMSVGLIASGQAQAQVASGSDASEVGDGAQTSADLGIEEIVVTAQRRAESLQKASVVLDVVSSETLSRAGVTGPTGLAGVLPSIQIGNAGPLLQVYIRGVGDAGVGATSNPAIAFNIDGVYVSRSQSISTEFYDVERVEVLKGPQGTLYGRNATGGAVNLLTRDPKLGEYGMRFSAELGNFDSAVLEGAVNIPLGENLAARVSGTYVRKDGYTSQNFVDDKHEAIRAKLLWEPSSDFSLLLNSSAGHIGGKGGSFSVIVNKIPGLPDQSPWLDQTDPLARDYLLASVPHPPLPNVPGLIDPPTPDEGFMDLNFWNVSAEMNVELGFGTLTVLPAYRHAKLLEQHLNFLRVSTGAGFGNIPTTPETSAQTTVEVRLANSSDKLQWVLGGYFYDENQDTQYVNRSGLIQNIAAKYSLDTRSYAAFGEATYSLSDSLRAIGGLRYTSDRRAIQGFSVALSPSLRCAGPSGTVCPSESFIGDKTYKNVSWKVGAEADVLDDSLLFATVSSGFKGGSFNVAIAPTAPPNSTDASSYRPETLLAYTVGLKNRFFDNRLQLNLEGFYWDYKDLQQARIAVSGAGNSAYSFDNAGKARMYGGSVDFIAKPWSGGTFSGGVEYLNARYTEFIVNQPARTLLPGSTGCPVTPSSLPPSPTAGPLVTIDCAGFEVTRSPKWSGSLAYTHHFDLAEGGAIEPSVDMRFASSRWLASDFVAAERGKSYQTFNASLTYISADDLFTFTGFVRNITNETVYQGAFEAPFMPGVVGVNIAPPRTYGVRMAMNF